MKKLLILLLFVGTTAMGQGIYVNSKLKYPISEFDFTKDTTFTFNMSTSYWWGFHLAWSDLDTTDSYMLVDASYFKEGDYFVPISDTLFFSTATGNNIVEDCSNAAIYSRLRLRFKIESVTSGKIKVKGDFKKVK